MLKKKVDFLPIVSSSNKFINYVTWNMVNKKKEKYKKLQNVDVL